MESTISYILIAIIVIVSVIVYNYKKQQVRIYLLSEQIYPELRLEVKIKKFKGLTSSILIHVLAFEDTTIKDIQVELISSKREFNSYSLDELISLNQLPIVLKKDTSIEYCVPFESYKALLRDGPHPFRTFRFMILSKNNKPYKSHEMGFNKKWVIYRPDSGNYN